MASAPPAPPRLRRRFALPLWLCLAIALPLAAEERAEEPDGKPVVREPGLAVGLEDGLTWTDDALPLHLRARGLLAADYRAYDSRNVRDSGLRLDRALVGADAEMGERFSARVLADLRGTDTRYGLEEAWGAVEVVPWRLRLTGGVVIVPLGIEHSFPEHTLPFVEYGYPAFVNGRTDLGVGVDGEFARGWLSYAVTATGGEGFDLVGNRRGDPQLAGRVVTYPFRPIDLDLDLGVYEIPLVSGFFLSAAGSYSWGFDGEIDYANSFRNKLVDTTRIDAERTYAYDLGYGFDLGPFRILHEFTRQTLLDVELPDDTKRDFRRQNSAWSASFAWRITGEPYDSRPYRQREHPPPLPATPLYRDGEWGPGAIEVAVRYSNAEIGRELIDLGFTSAAINFRRPGVSSQESRTFDVALNWIPFTPLRFTFQLTRTIADQHPTVFDSHGRDTSFLVRAQVSY